MKRVFFLFTLLTCLSLGAQEQKDWSVEIGAKAFAFIYHGSYDLTVGVRYKQLVFGLESGYGTFYVDAAPGHIGFLPVYGFARFYAPVTESGWLQLFGEVTADRRNREGQYTSRPARRHPRPLLQYSLVPSTGREDGRFSTRNITVQYYSKIPTTRGHLYTSSRAF